MGMELGAMCPQLSVTWWLCSTGVSGSERSEVDMVEVPLYNGPGLHHRLSPNRTNAPSLPLHSLLLSVRSYRSEARI